MPWWRTPDMIALRHPDREVRWASARSRCSSTSHGEAGAAPRVPAAGAGRRRRCAPPDELSLLDGPSHAEAGDWTQKKMPK